MSLLLCVCSVKSQSAARRAYLVCRISQEGLRRVVGESFDYAQDKFLGDGRASSDGRNFLFTIFD